jgi:undecaprenyl phosphate-alpha-L-ara4N flippase subunit ArnE
VTLFQYGQIFAVVAMMAGGQFLFRKSAIEAPPLSSLAGIATLIVNPVFILALVVYGAATLLWVAVLQQVPLSRAYAFTALSFVIVPAAAVFLLGETATPRFVVGLVLVIAGLLLIGAKG